MDNLAYKHLLEKRRDELLAMTDSIAEAAATVELDPGRVGRLSRMDAMQQQAMSKEEQRRHQLELRQVGTALDRIENDEYGLCLRCGKAITEPRLRVTPAVTLCIECAEQAEQEK